MGNSDFLFARPSILEGVARILDLGATMQEYNQSGSPAEADARAIYSDFKAVGNDISTAVDIVVEQIKKET